MRTLALASLTVGVVAACTGREPPPTSPSVTFAAERSVRLDTAVAATIGQPRAILPVDSFLLVADGMSGRIVRFDAKGRFVDAFGRIGDGPGEFRRPLDLEVTPQGSVLVADFGRKLVEVTPGLELVAEYRLDGPAGVSRLGRLGDRILVSLGGSAGGEPALAFWSRDRGVHDGFDARDERASGVPYWNATWSTWFATGASTLYVADSMVYPIRRYSGGSAPLESFGEPPPSWRPAREPEPGEFAMPGPTARDEWFSSFTTIDGVFVVEDRWLVVTHRLRAADPADDDEIRADLYALPGGEKVYADVALPGPALRGGDCLWVVADEPPGPWVFDCLVPR